MSSDKKRLSAWHRSVVDPGPDSVDAPQIFCRLPFSLTNFAVAKKLISPLTLLVLTLPSLFSPTTSSLTLDSVILLHLKQLFNPPHTMSYRGGQGGGGYGGGGGGRGYGGGNGYSNG